MEGKTSDRYLIKRFNKSISDLKWAEDRKKLAVWERKWVEDTPQLHALNYWFYRTFTKRFDMYLINMLENKK